MLIRLELHNHTTESDADITVRELIDIMVQDKVDAFALTDHNTISGHRKVRKILEQENPPIQCIYGMEYTTYYGHILCLNLTEYVPWENINRKHPEALFQAARDAGALVGVAHPFSYGDPFAKGCEWEMEITDYSKVEFIEVFNNPEPLHEVNEKGLLWGEKLVLEGRKLAMTAGMDLHGYMPMKGHYGTYIDCQDKEPLPKALERAIHTQRTYLTRGPVFEAYLSMGGAKPGISCKMHDVVKPGFEKSAKEWVVSFKTKEKEVTLYYSGKDEQLIAIEELGGGCIPVIVKLYDGDTRIENLVAISPVVYVP